MRARVRVARRRPSLIWTLLLAGLVAGAPARLAWDVWHPLGYATAALLFPAAVAFAWGALGGRLPR